MGRQGVRILVALFLMGLGVLLLLNNLAILPFDINGVAWFWAAVFSLGGLAFLAVFLFNREHWWAVIPGFTLLGLGMLIGLEPFMNEIGGAIFLGMIGLSFWVIYFTHRENWWAIIPGGVLLTLAGITLLGNNDNGYLAGGLLFLGLAATFLVVYLIPTELGRMRWSVWPAAVLAIMGALILTGASGFAQYVWPIAIILAGGFMVLRATQTR